MEEKFPLSSSSAIPPPTAGGADVAFTDDLPTSLINPNARFDFFREDDDVGSGGGGTRVGKAGGDDGQGDDGDAEEEDDDDEDDDEGQIPSYRFGRRYNKQNAVDLTWLCSPSLCYKKKRQKLLPKNDRVKRSTCSLASSSAGSVAGASASAGVGAGGGNGFRHPSFPAVPAGAR